MPDAHCSIAVPLALSSRIWQIEVISQDFFVRSVVDVARDLIGAALFYRGVGGIIVESEAYHYEDPASHSYAGRTDRNASMFGPPGHAYVYRSYGIHWCLNAVCGEHETGSAVLIRALQPTAGVEEMRLRRRLDDTHLLCAGPGRLCQALGISGADDGRPLDAAPFRLERPHRGHNLVVGPRIGISKAAGKLWRFGLRGSSFLSRPFPAHAQGAVATSSPGQENGPKDN